MIFYLPHPYRNGKRKYPIVISSIVIFLICLIIFIAHKNQSDNAKFERITKDIFQQEMLSNTLNMHYLISNPKNFGIDNYTPCLPAIHSDNENALAEMMLVKKELDAIDKNNLSYEDMYSYDLLTKYLENSISLTAFDYYNNILSPSGGLQTLFPILLCEYKFNTKRDVSDYLELLKQSGNYIDSLLTYEQNRLSCGFVENNISMTEISNQCVNLFSDNNLSSGKNILIESFCEKIDDLVTRNVIDSAAAKEYKTNNLFLLKNILYPAYMRLSEGCLSLAREIDTQNSSSHYDNNNGREYYKHLLISQTGCYREIDEIKELLAQKFQSEYKVIQKILQENNGFKDFDVNSLNDNFVFDNENEMIQQLISFSNDNFPSLNNFNNLSFKYSIKDVSKDLEEYTAPAFYLTVPVDNVEDNVIYINRALTPQGLSLFTTLAHEGYPGHMYQTVYSSKYSLQEECNPIRYILNYPGYQEGWALYVEFISFDYASEKYNSLKDTTTANYIQLEKHSRSMQLCLYSMLDILINYDNISLDDISDLLGKLGINSQASTNTIYKYISEEPCNYLKYYLSYLEILSLKGKAKELWNDSYSDYNFHKFYLDSGPSDFANLSKRLVSTIDEKN